MRRETRNGQMENGLLVVDDAHWLVRVMGGNMCASMRRLLGKCPGGPCPVL